jgi:hypothetical protein
MLSKAVTAFKKQSQNRQALSLIKTQMRLFSGGPYNPLHYKNWSVPEELPT